MKKHTEELQDNVKIERTKVFDEVANSLSKYINNLPLSSEQNDHLIKLIINQIQEAEQGAFIYGIRIGANVSEASNIDTQSHDTLIQ
ncbi:MAG TPA: hypothetical protein PKD52_11105 [Clostridiales bacterium]|nr:hypothetical protein [Clostridiales bacterium]